MELINLTEVLETSTPEASVPCRIDLGGTLDLRTFHYPLTHLKPSTFNIALDLRTNVRLSPYKNGMVKISSKGFESAEYPAGRASFSHPMGLMFAVSSYFGVSGVHIQITSSSPPRSALGGSSAAAVALAAVLEYVMAEEEGDEKKAVSRKHIAMLAHTIEETVAGVPCGMQDQLAAAYGGINEWLWPGKIGEQPFQRNIVLNQGAYPDLEKHLLVAYCGIPHESKNINGKWVKDFLDGRFRSEWEDIISITKNFIDSLSSCNYKDAASAMNMETGIRMGMTPDVVDEIGKRLVKSASENKCGARFTGAGGGGCVWALGEPDDIKRLKHSWLEILSKTKEGRLLTNRIDSDGLIVTSGRQVSLNN